MSEPTSDPETASRRGDDDDEEENRPDAPSSRSERSNEPNVEDDQGSRPVAPPPPQLGLSASRSSDAASEDDFEDAYHTPRGTEPRSKSFGGTPETVASPDGDAVAPSPVVVPVVVGSPSSTPRKAEGGVVGARRGLVGAFASRSTRWFGALVAYSVIATVGTSVLYDSYKRASRLSPVLADVEAQVDELARENERLREIVDALTVQVDELEDQVVRLEGENERYETLNAVLESNVTALSDSVSELRKENREARSTVNELTIVNGALETRVTDLNATVDRVGRENDRLEKSVDNLGAEIDRLENTRDDLEIELKAAERSLDRLETQVTSLNATNSDLENSVSALNATVVEYGKRNDELETYNSQLESLVAFLDDTSEDVDRTLNATVVFLDDLVTTYRGLALRTLESQQATEVDTWRCGLLPQYGTATSWIADPDAPVGTDDAASLLRYVDRDVLTPLCADADDFAVYLATTTTTTTTESLTLRGLSNALELYAAGLHDFYFPDGEDAPDDAISPIEWERAAYRCDALDRSYAFADASS